MVIIWVLVVHGKCHNSNLCLMAEWEGGGNDVTRMNCLWVHVECNYVSALGSQ